MSSLSMLLRHADMVSHKSKPRLPRPLWRHGDVSVPSCDHVIDVISIVKTHIKK